MRRASRRLSVALLAVIVVISIWTPLAHDAIAHRWFSFPNIIWFSPVPILVVAATVLLRRALNNRDSHALPFVLTLALVFLGYSGLGISLWPTVIPPSTSIWDAAGPSQSLGFALVGALLIIPIILVYTAWSYWVFRGKVRAGEGYH
jgi:cytochrome d ubiquinol oxidase subunit II